MDQLKKAICIYTSLARFLISEILHQLKVDRNTSHRCLYKLCLVILNEKNTIYLMFMKKETPIFLTFKIYT